MNQSIKIKLKSFIMINKKGFLLLFVSYTIASPQHNQVSSRLSLDCSRSCKVDFPCQSPKKCMAINDECDMCLDPKDMEYNFCLKDTDCLENEHCPGGKEATLQAGTCEEKTPNCRSKYDCGSYKKCLIKETWNGIKEGWCVSIDACFEDSDCIPGQTCDKDFHNMG